MIVHGAVVNHCKHEGCTRQAIKREEYCVTMERLNYERNATTRGVLNTPKRVDCVRNIDVSCCRSRSRCGRGIHESTTTGGGRVLGAAPRPSHLPFFPVGGPPESVILSIILDDNDDALRCCLTSGHFLPFRSIMRRRRKKIE